MPISSNGDSPVIITNILDGGSAYALVADVAYLATSASYAGTASFALNAGSSSPIISASGIYISGSWDMVTEGQKFNITNTTIPFFNDGQYFYSLNDPNPTSPNTIFFESQENQNSLQSLFYSVGLLNKTAVGLYGSIVDLQIPYNVTSSLANGNLIGYYHNISTNTYTGSLFTVTGGRTNITIGDGTTDGTRLGSILGKVISISMNSGSFDNAIYGIELGISLQNVTSSAGVSHISIEPSFNNSRIGYYYGLNIAPISSFNAILGDNYAIHIADGETPQQSYLGAITASSAYIKNSTYAWTDGGNLFSTTKTHPSNSWETSMATIGGPAYIPAPNIIYVDDKDGDVSKVYRQSALSVYTITGNSTGSWNYGLTSVITVPSSSTPTSSLVNIFGAFAMTPSVVIPSFVSGNLGLVASIYAFMDLEGAVTSNIKCIWY